jgi:hypothetical protein
MIAVDVTDEDVVDASEFNPVFSQLHLSTFTAVN